MFGAPKPPPVPPPPPPPPPPPNPPTYADAMAGKSPSSNAGPIGGLASTILTSPAGVLQSGQIGGKTLLGG